MLPTPVRAYLLDSVPPEKSERGNSIYASMINVGSTVGAVIACIPWKKLGLGEDDILGVQVKVLFGITVAVVIIAQLFTLCSVKERMHLTDQDPFIVHKESSPVIKLVQIDHSRDNQNSPDVKDVAAVSAEIADSTNSGVTNEFSEQDLSDGTKESCSADGRDNQNSTDTEDLAVVSVEMSNSGAKNDLGEASSSDQPVNGEKVEQHADFEVSSEGNLLVEESSNESGTFQTKCNCFGLKPSSCFEDIVGSIYGTFLFVKYMSFTYLRLWVLVCFSWFAYIAMNGFFTTFVGEVVYGGSPLSEDKELKDNFDEGVIVGSVALAVQCFVALVYSLASEWITKCFGLRPVVIGAHVAFLVTCGVTVLYPTVLTAMVINVVVGVYFALLVNFPFALISYYKDSGLLLRKPWLRESDTKGKAVAFILMGLSLSQLVLGLSMGFIISAFGTTRIVLVVVLIGECFATVSALFLTTKPASCDHQWCSWKPLVKCFRRLIHRETQDKNHQVQAKNETSEV